VTALAISVAGSVWDDYLDPATSGMEGELALTPLRTVKRHGRGRRVMYEPVTVEQALDLADYLRGRAHVMLSNSEAPFDPAYTWDYLRERQIHNAALVAADVIEKAVLAAQREEPR
jgi:hypothetical protein